MNLKKFALRGLAILAVFVALCMFFSGTIKTITTAKIKTTRGRSGRLEEKIQLSGKLVFPNVQKVDYALESGVSLQITKVNFRAGYTVNEGDTVIQARVTDYDATMKTYQEEYTSAAETLQQLESKNADIRLRRTDTMYADAYFALRDARRETVSEKIAMNTLLTTEGLTLPETGTPEGASEALIQAIEAYRAAAQTEADAEAAMQNVERYTPEESVWSYITEKHDAEEKMAAAEKKMEALSVLNADVQNITAPNSGYIAQVSVKEGDTYDGTGELFTLTQSDSMPVLRADLTDVKKTITQGTSVTVSGGNYDVETTVASVGIDQEGKKYADVAVNEDILNAVGSVYSLTLEETPMTIINRAKQNTTLITTAAIHGTGTNRYVYTVETSYSSFGNSTMKVHKQTVNVLAEANGTASVEEDLTYYDIAYMEDRAINDGDTVMLYE